MEQRFIGTVYQVEGVQALTNGFKQVVILHVPEQTGTDERVIAKEEYFSINIWCKEQTDKKFLSSSDRGKQRSALCRLRGERWWSQYNSDYVYALKIHLKNWE